MRHRFDLCLYLFVNRSCQSGFFCGVGPLYLSELPPENLRGLLGTINALAICAGALLSNVLGLPSVLGSSTLWPYLLSFMFIPVIVHLVGLPFCIESPKYLYITKKQPEKAQAGRLVDTLFFFFFDSIIFISTCEATKQRSRYSQVRNGSAGQRERENILSV